MEDSSSLPFPPAQFSFSNKSVLKTGINPGDQFVSLTDHLQQHKEASIKLTLTQGQDPSPPCLLSAVLYN